MRVITTDRTTRISTGEGNGPGLAALKQKGREGREAGLGQVRSLGALQTQ